MRANITNKERTHLNHRRWRYVNALKNRAGLSTNQFAVLYEAAIKIAKPDLEDPVRSETIRHLRETGLVQPVDYGYRATDAGIEVLDRVFF